MSSYEIIQYGASDSTKIAGFDMDSTLIQTKSGRTFPIDASDWRFKYGDVTERLNRLAGDGYRIAVISNQLGVSKGKTTPEALREKVRQIMAHISAPVTWIFAFEDDLFRKPRVGAFKLLNPDSESFYCGDACGRPKDFSNSDLKFAKNAGIRFYSEEQFFAGVDDSCLWTLPPKFELAPWTPLPKHTTREMVILVGPPASGKSTLCALEFPDYAITNQDTLGTLAKCKRAAKEAIVDASSRSLVIDATNRTAKVRQVWVDMAAEHGVAVRFIVIHIPKDLAMHVNTYRHLTGGKRIPAVSIHSFYKQFEPPATGDIDIIPFRLKKGVADESLFGMYL